MASSRWCSASRLLRPAEREHLHLVELVHAQDAADVLAVRPGLPAVARRPARVPLRAVQVEDLVRVVRRQRHLRRADQVQVVGLEPVDLAGVRAEEAGALHRLRPHQRRRDRRREAVLHRLLDRHLQHPELQQRADAGEEVEPRAGHLRAALGVDRLERLADLQVVLRMRRCPGCRRPRAARRSRPRRRPARRPATMLGTARCARRSAWSASAAAASAALTSAASSLVRASSAARSSPDAFATCLPRDFCSARTASNRCVAARRSSSARSRSSTARWTRRAVAGWHGSGRGLREAGAGQSRLSSLPADAPYLHPDMPQPSCRARRACPGHRSATVNGFVDDDGQVERLVRRPFLVLVGPRRPAP